MTGIYKITNRDDGKVYIGQSVDIKHRRACHFHDLKNNKHKNLHLQRAYNKSKEGFDFEVICTCKEEDLNELEIFYIKKYDSCNPKFGYNIDLGGNGSGRMSEETKRKLSESKKGNQFMKGIKLSDDWKKHLSEAQPHKKRIVCIETNEVYESFADAARKTGLQRTKIVSVCTGKRKKTGGYHFKYADETASG